MSDPAQLLVDHLDIWTGAIERKSGSGRGNGGKIRLYGIDKLRSLILDLAVRGKLVPQDPADGNAGELIKALDQQASKPSIRKLVSKYFQKGPLAENSDPFTVPSNWAWVNVAKLGHNWGQSEPEAEFTYIDVGSIDQRAGIVIEPNIVEAKDAPSRARKIVRRGTVIYSTVRPYLLNIAVVDAEFDPSPIASTAFAVIHPFAGVDAQYVYRVLRSPFFVKYVEGCQTGIAYPAINDKQFFNAPFPLPPLAEQKRIVAKVDELMALVDALEEGTRASMEAHEILVRELLASLVNSRDADDLAQSWSRIETHFDTLFTTEDSIEALKQTVLELAVRGKFSKSTETNVRGREYDRKQPKPSETPFAIPEHWRWARLSTIGQMKGGGTPAKSNEAFWSGEIPWVSPKDMKRDILNDAELHISEAAIEESSAKLVAPRSIMFVVRGMILAHSFPVGVNSVPVAINQDMKAIELFEPASAEYFLMVLKGLKGEMLSKIGRSSHGTCKLESEKYSDFWVPVSSDAEQTKLVQLVAQLHSLCDGAILKIRAQTQYGVLVADVLSAQSAA